MTQTESVARELTLIRSTAVKMLPTDHQRKLLDVTTRAVHGLAKEWCDHLLSMKNSSDRRMVELYTTVLGAKNTRGYRSYLQDPDLKSAKSKADGIGLAMTLRDEGLLPFQFEHRPPTVISFVALEMATSLLSSYDECNAATECQYGKALNALNAIGLSESDIDQINAFEVTLGGLHSNDGSRIPVPDKLYHDFKKYSFDARNWPDAMEAARLIDGDERHWLKLFRYSVARDRLAGMRQHATLTLPDPAACGQPWRFGHNYLKFSLTQSGRSISAKVKLYDGVKIVDEVIQLAPSNYWRQLTVNCDNDFGRHDLNYRRGNASRLQENVSATVSELTFRRHGGNYYLNFPLKLRVTQDHDAAAACTRYFNLQPVSYDKPIMTGDLGRSRFWNWAVYSQGSEIGRGTVGDPQHGSLGRSYAGLTKDLVALRHLISFRKLVNGGKRPHARFLPRLIESMARLGFDPVEPDGGWADSEIRGFISSKLYEIGQRVRDYRRYDKHRQRQVGISHEHMDYVELIKTYIRVLKGWAFYGADPEARKTSSGFESWNRYLFNLRKDLIRKSAQQLIYAARQNDCKLVVIEDLTFAPSLQQRRKFNDMLMVWSPKAVLDWVKHFADQYGIVVVQVNPAYTSQIDPATGQWAHRDQYDKSKLFVRRDGRVRMIHADLDAACRNLHDQFMDRVGWVKNITVTKHGDRYVAVTASAKAGTGDDDGPSVKGGTKTQDAFLLRTYGTKSPTFAGEDGVMGVAAVGPGQAITARKPGEGRLVLYRHGDRWLFEHERRRFKQEICDQASAERDGPA